MCYRQHKLSPLAPVLIIILFRPTAHTNDNISLLESGFNKEIEKNTAKLLKSEKEFDVYQSIKQYLDQDSKGLLQPEAEAGQPTFKIFLSFKSEHVSHYFEVS